MKSSDSALLVLLRCRASMPKGCGPVLEQLFLPVLEHRWLDVVLIAKIRDGDTLDEMASQDGNFLDRIVVLT
jgi:hypothetical protein